MFKKVIHIILASLILAVTTGFTLSKHYCGEKMVSVSINAEAEPCCDDMDTSDCCHNETEHFQLKVDYLNFASDISFQNLDLDILFPVLYCHLQNSFFFEAKQEVRYPEYPPPPDRNTYLATIQAFLC